ncbi:hypothetical protein DMN91_007001 [Ooceraea biroi]|uniref:RNA polymerase II nuclear localization protein SLC7A6OS n=1 Tax=Ooceraea biroi TaxID=2015173 RepID=A0A026X5I7_OOCBI|nr:probable RNA polymerase II nuclear localization protein SLC7A6OS [Ooceraea biroi]EZA62704.1 hypothetical protein X777_07519 [Ooceraea biroi]RLU20392.1 hypothetical protein DMN91_007001 [Ooceraea biroi]
MTTVLRVKRRISEPPSDSLMLSFLAKRQKLNLPDDSDALVTPAETIAQFAGTLRDPTEDVTQHLAKILPEVNTENIRGTKRSVDNDNAADTSGNVPKLAKVESLRDRYKIISCHPLNEEKSENKCTTLVEIEDCWSSRALDQDREEATEEEQKIERYVYDLYYAQTNIDLEQNNIAVHEWISGYPDEESSESGCDTENENSESHPQNDYPDTDPDRSDREYDSESSLDLDNDFLDEFPVNRRYSNYRHIAQNYDTDTTSEQENDSDESLGIL